MLLLQCCNPRWTRLALMACPTLDESEHGIKLFIPLPWHGEAAMSDYSMSLGLVN